MDGFVHSYNLQVAVSVLTFVALKQRIAVNQTPFIMLIKTPNHAQGEKQATSFSQGLCNSYDNAISRPGVFGFWRR